MCKGKGEGAKGRRKGKRKGKKEGEGKEDRRRGQGSVSVHNLVMKGVGLHRIQ